MTVEKLTKKIFRLINRAKILDVSSLNMDFSNNQELLLELNDGSKFQIIVISTERTI